MQKILSYVTIAAQAGLGGLFAYAFANSVLYGILGGVLAFLCAYFKTLNPAACWGPWDRVFNGLFSLGVVTYFVLALVYHWPQIMQFYAVVGGAAWGIIAVAILKSLFVKHKAQA